MGFKTQKGFLFTGSGDGLKYVSGKRQSWYISEQGNPGITDSPVFQSAATSGDGTKVILTYNKALSSTTAATSAFVVTVASSTATVSSVGVSGSTIELTMGTAITSGQTITVAYTDPSSGEDANAIQDTIGNDAASLSTTSVTNSVTSNTATVYDFTTGSIPSDWTENSLRAQLTTSWSDSTDGDYFLIKGDAGSHNTGYPLRFDTAQQGDTLFQLSFRSDGTSPTCRDWSIAVSPNDASSTNTNHWHWVWSYATSRIAALCDCSQPKLHGFTSSSNTGGNVENTAGWYTMHLMVYTSSASTKLKVTQGDQDWDASDTQIGNVASISERVVANDTTDYWVGISADNDNGTFAKANAFRISTISSEFF
tara:strand:+ start:282 stop:1382 length:1101 start_codon:yes stop_codon:yes gene_type:complete